MAYKRAGLAERASSDGSSRRDTLDFDAATAGDIRDRLRRGGRSAVGATGRWVLESRLGKDDIQRTPVQPVPFTIGRVPGLDLVLPSIHVSKTHAMIYSDGVALHVRDLGSRNGTFLNHRPVSDAALHEADVLGIGNYEFHLLPDDGALSEAAETIPLTRHIAAARVRQLIETGAVGVRFQPVIAFASGRLEAYEALGFGCDPELPQGPVELFDLAGALGPEAQAQLSRLFRRKALELVRDRERPPVLFLNTHPVDLEYPGLLESLEDLRLLAPTAKLVLEVHESALADPGLIAWLQRQLGQLGIGLAYDDFGAGQARLLELAEMPPDYLKFDRRFITGIESAPGSRRRLLASLVAAARELEVRTIAEGIETAEEAAECRRAGFTHAQGYFFGRPGDLPGEDAPLG